VLILKTPVKGFAISAPVIEVSVTIKRFPVLLKQVVPVSGAVGVQVIVPITISDGKSKMTLSPA
jgi:hypothetical protein